MENQHAYPTHRWLVLAVACLAIMSCYMNIVAYAPLISQIALSFKIDTGRAMHLISVTYLVTALTLFFAGLICDRYGVRPALLLGLFASVVPALFVPFISNFGPLMIARIFQGISPAFVMVIVGPITGMWFPRREQGIASGLMMGSLSLGAAVGLAAGPVLWKLTDSWQLAVTLLSLLGWLSLALTLLIWSHAAMPSDARIPHGMDPEASSAFKAAIASPVTWVGTAIFFFAAWGMHSLYALVPAYLSAPLPTGIGLSPVLSGKLSLALTVIGIVGVPAGGFFLDRVLKGNYRIVIAAGFILTAVFSYLILLPFVYNSLFLLILCLVVAGWGIPFTSSSTIAFAVTSYPLSIVGRMLGWMGGLGTFGGAAGVYLGGIVVSETGAFYGAIALISIAAGLGCVLACFLKSAGMKTATVRSEQVVR